MPIKTTGLIIAYLLLLNGCATTSLPSPQSAGSIYQPAIPRIQGLAGIYHRLEKGQTLWSISKMYSVDLNDLIRINNITDASQMRLGQSIFIPHAARPIKSGYPKKNTAENFLWPAKGKVFSGFGEKNDNVINKGINLRIYPASDVIASRSGTVVFTNNKLRGYGKTVIMDHGDGYMTIYTFLSQILVKPGEYINQGTPIAKAEGGIVHFEIRKGYLPQNPSYYLSS